MTAIRELFIEMVKSIPQELTIETPKDRKLFYPAWMIAENAATMLPGIMLHRRILSALRGYNHNEYLFVGYSNYFGAEIYVSISSAVKFIHNKS